MLIPKVLLVNDDPASLFALESLLMGAAIRLEYELLSAGSGQAALRQVLRHDFAVILLDVSMPGMDGFETAAAIHSHPRSYAVPIIFITANYADEIKRLQAYQSGAADYLCTPIIPQVLQAKVAVFVELTKRNIELQVKSEQLARLNQDLRVQRLQDLERINGELELEVAERKQAEQLARELSIRDPLTGLANRRWLLQQLEHAVATADRGQSEFALLLLDLDQFKQVNDRFGHEAGDELLRQVAARLMACVRTSDVVARLGSDEFVVLVEGKAACANAARVARKIGQTHARPYDIGKLRLKASGSIGIALYPQDGDSAQSVLRNADLAMYHAKQAHGGSVKFFHEELSERENENQRQCEAWRRELRGALDSGQFELRYQPKIELATGRIAGVEALLYWHHPRQGAIEASAWQACVPDPALLDQIDDWCIGAACAQAARWRDAALPGLAHDCVSAGPGSAPRIALKLMSSQLQADLPQKIIAQLLRHQLAPGSIELELPEALLCGPVADVGAVLRPLRAAGVRIAVDSFGSLGASLTACQALPLDTFKIGSAFVRAIGSDDGGAGMAAAIIRLAQALSLCTVALGVQSPAQLAHLSELGCEQYQGDLFCEPVAAAELPQRVRLAIQA